MMISCKPLFSSSMSLQDVGNFIVAALNSLGGCSYPFMICNVGIGPSVKEALDHLGEALGGGVVEERLLGVFVDIKLWIFLGEPDENVVAAVNVGILRIPPTLRVLT